MKLIEPTYDLAPATAVDQPTATGVGLVWGKELAWLLCVLAIVAIGIWLRITPSAGFTGTGFDEALYRNYIVQLERVGLSGYPAICEHYIRDQRKPETITKLPPTRFLYIFSGWVWKRVAFGDAPPAPITAPNFAQIDPALISLHRVSAFFSILMLVVTAAWAPRLCGKMNGMAVVALMAFAPLQIHMAQHALIDGFFAFWATLSLWMLWENLQRPNNPAWSSALAISLAMMVLTKENAFFVYVGFWGLLGLNRWVPFGIITRKLLLVMIIGPLSGLVILITLAGGADTFIDIYRLLVSKAQNLTYAIKTGDGPWHRYLVDMMLVSPIVLCLALGGVVTAVRENRAALYLTAFIVFSYLVMCNVRYGMNLRYATIWDLPIRVLAVSQLALIAGFFGNRRMLAFAVGIAALCAYELKQYVTFFKDFGLYELVSEGLLRAVKILK